MKYILKIKFIGAEMKIMMINIEKGIDISKIRERKMTSKKLIRCDGPIINAGRVFQYFSRRS